MGMTRQRDLSIDVLRGWAIMLMMAGHVIFFRFGLSSWPLTTILLFANSFCYITFLFTFGVGLHYGVVTPVWDSLRKQKVLRRFFALMGTYYLAAIVSVWSNYALSMWHPALLLGEVKRVVLFQYFPGFTEYLPSFALLTAVAIGLRRMFGNRLVRWFQAPRVWIVLCSGLILHFLSNWIVGQVMVVPPALRLLLGSSQTFDFPILQYLPIVLAGLSAAVWTRESGQKTENKVITVAYLLILTTLGLKYSFTVTNALGIQLPMLNTPLRWPPSLLFLVEGLAYTFLFWVVSRWMLLWRLCRPLVEILLYMGQRSMAFLLYHLLLLFGMKILGVPLFSYIELLFFYIAIPLSYRLGELLFTRIRLKSS